MKLKKIKKLHVNSTTFKIKWTPKHAGGSFSYTKKQIEIGTKWGPGRTFEVLCHELLEICAIEMHVRYQRPDVEDDYMFVYDHRQHDTMANMFSALIAQFVDQGPS